MARSSGSDSASIGRASSRFLLRRLPLAILADHLAQVALLLGDLAILRGVADDRVVGHLGRQLLKAALDIVEFFLIFHGVQTSVLGDDQFAALLLFERHGASRA